LLLLALSGTIVGASRRRKTGGGKQDQCAENSARPGSEQRFHENRLCFKKMENENERNLPLFPLSVNQRRFSRPADAAKSGRLDGKAPRPQLDARGAATQKSLSLRFSTPRARVFDAHRYVDRQLR
jgi:hypothetical protein